MTSRDKRSAEECVEGLLISLGYDYQRDGLQETPRRVVKFLIEMCLPEPFTFTTFKNDGGSEMVVQAGIPFASLCEHHILPFVGHATVSYVPRERLVGLSKLARAVKFCASGLQTQERITKAIADMLDRELAPAGVAVLLRAEHSCMTIRGVHAPGSITTTSCLRGVFMDDARCRSEFMSLAQGGAK